MVRLIEWLHYQTAFPPSSRPAKINDDRRMKMPSALGIEKSKQRCDYCGAVYEVILTRFADRQASSHTCEVCGSRMEWQSIFVPSEFKLIKHPDAIGG
jgi:hypothetical protein